MGTRPASPAVVSSETSSPTPDVQQVVLATDVDADGAPREARTVFPEKPGRLFLCVLAGQMHPGTQFRAVWYEDGEVVGQSDFVVQDPGDSPQWVSLAFLPVFPLKPTVDHWVELQIDLAPIDRYVFRVGAGDAADIVAEAALGTGVGDDRHVTGEATRFHVDTQQIALVVRISTMVNPNPLSFDTIWYRDDVSIAQLGPLDGQPRVESTPTADDLRMAFVFAPQAALVPGTYHVDLMLNGVAIASYPFTVTTERQPTPTPTATPSPTPEPTNTPAPTATATVTPTGTAARTPTQGAGNADVVDLVVAPDIDLDTNEPIGGPVFVWEADPSSVVTLWFAIGVTDLSEDDVLEIVVTLNDQEYGTRKLPAESVGDGWVATLVGLDSPGAGAEPYIYTVSVLLNGQRTLDTSFQVSAIEGP